MGLRRILSRRTVRDQPTIPLEADDVYSVLSVPRRRHVLSILDENAAGVIPLRDLAQKVARQETDIDSVDVPSEAVDAVYVALYQSHVPVLHRHGAVEWEREENLVREGDSASALATLIRDIDDRTQDD
ncbi:hypothetical protein [Natrinema sp. CBA1119]|uniref:DUF7344 domain-containing protein n=1 Tax=Natrinema sp. CBA1119 TaxID=1608465 RepID=UPI00114573F6|nr:hypothetical protein [Natrinema sp. CBA1119]